MQSNYHFTKLFFKTIHKKCIHHLIKKTDQSNLNKALFKKKRRTFGETRRSLKDNQIPRNVI